MSFQCPNCGGYKWGTIDCGRPKSEWFGVCNGSREYSGCGFTWHRATEDEKVLGLPFNASAWPDTVTIPVPPAEPVQPIPVWPFTSPIRPVPPAAEKHAQEDQAAKAQQEKLIETRRELRKMLGQG